ncbi:MAG: hypothetical protein R3333_11540 [Lishizhenia sp.]|nr:hypothetical protein [Lishizhenia sp.]
MIKYKLEFKLVDSLIKNQRLLRELSIFKAKVKDNSTVYINHQGGSTFQFEDHFKSFLRYNEQVIVSIYEGDLEIH